MKLKKIDYFFYYWGGKLRRRVIELDTEIFLLLEIDRKTYEVGLVT